MKTMYRILSTISLKTKAVALLLCLGFTLVKSCPGQKLLSNSSLLNISEHLDSFTSSDNQNLTCSYSAEVVETPLIDHTNRSSSNVLFFVLISSLFFSIHSLLINGCSQYIKNRKIFVSPVPLFLRNQVFRI